jgi:hypothetical protein
VRFGTLLERGYAVVPVLAVPAFVTARLPGRRLLVTAVLLGFWPVVLNEVPGLGVSAWSARMWLGLCGVLAILLVLSAEGGWRRLGEAWAHLEEMIPASPARSVLIERWMARLLTRRAQYACAVPVAAGVVVLLHLVRPALAPDVPVGPMSYVMVAWVGFLGGNVVYWLCAMGALPRRLRRCGPVRLLRHDPAMTPGLVAMADGYLYVAGTMGMGVLVTEVLALMLPNRSDSSLLSGVVFWFPILAGAIALWAAIQPFFPIYQIARTTWRQTLRELSPEVENRDPVTTELYYHVRGVSLLPINTSTIVQYCAAILGVLGGFAIPKLLA